jgi:hypothetical protein
VSATVFLFSEQNGFGHIPTSPPPIVIFTGVSQDLVPKSEHYGYLTKCSPILCFTLLNHAADKETRMPVLWLAIHRRYRAIYALVPGARIALVFIVGLPASLWAQDQWDCMSGVVCHTSSAVGIGTSNPAYPLDIGVDTTQATGLRITNSGSGTAAQIQVKLVNAEGGQGFWGVSDDSFSGFGPLNSGTAFLGGYGVPVSIHTIGARDIFFSPNSAEAMRIKSGGNVGIGTTNPLYPLSVNGTIQAKEVLVNTGWSDYVFDPGYRLAPLTEVAAYVSENHHLPEIPSAKEVEEKGVSLGEMQSKLLAKIEELTLHMIRAEQENRELREQIRELRDKVGK